MAPAAKEFSCFNGHEGKFFPVSASNPMEADLQTKETVLLIAKGDTIALKVTLNAHPPQKGENHSLLEEGARCSFILACLSFPKIEDAVFMRRERRHLVNWLCFTKNGVSFQTIEEATCFFTITAPA